MCLADLDQSTRALIDELGDTLGLSHQTMPEPITEAVQLPHRIALIMECPFCGGPCHSFHATAWGVTCDGEREDNEECAGRSDEGYYTSERAAIEAWNRRV